VPSPTYPHCVPTARYAYDAAVRPRTRSPNPRALLWSGIAMLVLAAGAVAFGVWRIEWNSEQGRPHQGWVRGTGSIAGGAFAAAVGVARLFKARRLQRDAARERV
jgi:hypothetical protein